MDIQNEAKEGIKTRLSSPFFGAFISSWLILYWKVVVAFIYGPDGGGGRIEYIASLINFSWTWEAAFRLLGRPAILASVFIILHLCSIQIYYYIERWFRHKREMTSIEDRLDLSEFEAYREILKDMVSAANSTMTKVNQIANAMEKDCTAVTDSLDSNVRAGCAANLKKNFTDLKRLGAEWSECNAVRLGGGGKSPDVKAKLVQLFARSKLKANFVK